MNLAPWILHVVLAVSFALAGGHEAHRAKGEAGRAPSLGPGLSPATVKLIGTAQGAAALALILPAATGSRPCRSCRWSWPRPGWSC
jgi:hypothetical protein